MLVAITTGCIHTDAVVCDDGLICPGGTVCAQVTNPSAELCVTPDQISACVGKAPLDTCELTGATIARCYDGVCLPAGCGNGRVDPGEVCDDGNSVTGDGCSSACQSNETCGNGIVDPVKLVNGIAVPDEQCDDKNNVSGDGCSSDCQLEAPQWQQLIPSLPGAREASAMVYDSARGRVVLFGGATKFGSALVNGPTSVLGDTWEWDGAGWISTSIPVSPGARAGHAMAYDAARRRVVLFGGSGSTTFGDTWLYDGVTWTLLNPAHAPTPRSNAAAAYDSARQKLVVFGGLDASSTTNAETWEWDGTDWTQVQLSAAPPARSGAVMAYDPVRAVVVMAGGGLADTWEYDGAQWRDVTPASPANQTDQVSDFAMTYDRVTGKVVINGPATSGTGTDTWGWNGQVWTRLLAGSASTPSYRSDMTMVGDPVHGTVILVGGDASIGLCFPHALYNCLTTFNDAWTWNGSAWTAVAVAAPPPLAFVASAFDSWRGRLVIFGGESAGPTYSGATWEFDGGHWTLRTTPTAPSLRQNTAMAFDAIHHKTVLFGGFDINTSQALGDTWSWDGTTWTQLLPTTVVPPRYSQTMAFAPVRGRVVMFGGDPASTHDTWEWDGTNWIATSPATDPGFGVDAASMTYDPIRQRMVLTDGSGSGEIWEWDGATWTLLDPIETPGTRANAATAWNAPRRRIELFGGGYNSSYNDLWEWDGTVWTPQIPIGAPEPRNAHSLTTSPDGVGVLLYGGLDSTNGFLGDLWRLRWTSTQATELCTLDVDNDGDGLSGCADPDCWATCTPLCPPGVTCDPSWPHCGDGTCSPVENCRICPQDCGACAPICGDTFCDTPETHGSCPGDCP